VISVAAGQNLGIIVTNHHNAFSFGQKSAALGIKSHTLLVAKLCNVHLLEIYPNSAQRDYYAKPQLIRGLQGKKIISVSCSSYSKPHVLALSSFVSYSFILLSLLKFNTGEGGIYSFGSNTRGQLGVGDRYSGTLDRLRRMKCLFVLYSQDEENYTSEGAYSIPSHHRSLVWISTLSCSHQRRKVSKTKMQMCSNYD